MKNKAEEEAEEEEKEEEKKRKKTRQQWHQPKKASFLLIFPTCQSFQTGEKAREKEMGWMMGERGGGAEREREVQSLRLHTHTNPTNNDLPYIRKSTH